MLFGSRNFVGGGYMGDVYMQWWKVSGIHTVGASTMHLPFSDWGSYAIIHALTRITDLDCRSVVIIFSDCNKQLVVLPSAEQVPSTAKIHAQDSDLAHSKRVQIIMKRIPLRNTLPTRPSGPLRGYLQFFGFTCVIIFFFIAPINLS